jgi:lipopolysaccharide/colanic/teichoic acid biosynthesis glycosyltransferase
MPRAVAWLAKVASASNLWRNGGEMARHKEKAIGESDADLDSVIPAADLNSGAARLIDIIGAAVGLIFFGPMLLAVALAIKLDSRGPVFVRETQNGCKNRRIEVLKFRLASTGAQGEQRYPRPTWIGHMLHGTRVDELLRLINVLRGEASFFGPRP